MGKRKVIFNSPHANYEITAEPRNVTRNVNGILQVVKEDQQKILFENGQFATDDAETIKFMRKHRHYGKFFEEVPSVVEKEIVKEELEEKKAELEAGASDSTDARFIPADVQEELIEEELAEINASVTAEVVEEAISEPETSNAGLEEVNSYNEAQDFLRAEPYSLDWNKVSSKAKLIASMNELGIDFPNYNPEED